MKTDYDSIRGMLERRARLSLTNEQIEELLPETGSFEEEIRSGSVGDTAPREVLINALCIKITEREVYTIGERLKNPEEYDKWIESFCKNAEKMGYVFVD